MTRHNSSYGCKLHIITSVNGEFCNYDDVLKISMEKSGFVPIKLDTQLTGLDIYCKIINYFYN